MRKDFFCGYTIDKPQTKSMVIYFGACAWHLKLDLSEVSAALAVSNCLRKENLGLHAIPTRTTGA